MVNFVRVQSQEQPRRRSWLRIVPPYLSFQAQTSFTKASRPMSIRRTFFSS